MNPLLYQDNKGYFEQSDFFQYWNLKRETEYHVSYTHTLEPETGYLTEFNALYPGLKRGMSSLLHSASPGIALIGGAGTGKTQLLASLAGYWIDKTAYKPGEILVFTFTDSGIPVLSEGILQAAKGKGAGIEVTGIEGFCLTLLSLVYGKTPRIFDKMDRAYFITLIFPFLGPEQKKRLSSFISSSKEESSSQKKSFSLKTSSPEQGTRDDIDQDFPHLRDTYFHSLHTMGACDRDVLALQAGHLITTNPGILLSIQQKYKCIFIDDLHSMDKDHYSLISQVILHTIFLESEARGNQKIIITLDPFRGVHKTNSEQIPRTFLSRFIRQHYYLHTSWRVPGRILKGLSRLHKNNKPQKQKIPQAHKGAGEYILLYQAKTPDEEGDFIIKTILSYIQKENRDQVGGYSLKDFGIFCRTTAPLEGILVGLKEQRLPFSQYDNHDTTMEQLPFHIVYSFFHFLLSERDITAFVDILLHLIPGFSIGDIQSIFLAGNRKDESVTQLIRRLYAEQKISETQYTGIVTFQKNCAHIKKEVSQSGILSGIRLLIAEYPGLARRFRDYFAKFPGEKQGFIDHANACHKDILQFLTGRFSLSKTRIHSGTDAKSGTHQQYIQVATFEQAHYFTPSIVFIPGMEEDNCPLYSESPDMNREKALFYSALTRAKEQVYLSFAEKRSGERLRMSSFIKEMGPHIKEIIHTIPAEDFKQGTLF